MEKESLFSDPSENWGCRANPLLRDLEKQQNSESHTCHLFLEPHLVRKVWWCLWQTTRGQVRMSVSVSHLVGCYSKILLQVLTVSIPERSLGVSRRQRRRVITMKCQEALQQSQLFWGKPFPVPYLTKKLKGNYQLQPSLDFLSHLRGGN